MPRISEAPFALVDIVRCSKSWTTVDVERCSQCSPTNGSPGRRRLAGKQSPGRRRVPRAITTRKKTYVDEQSWIAPQKPNRHAPRARFSRGRGFRRHLLSRYSMCAEVRDGEDRGLRRCGFSREQLRKTGSRLTEDCGYMAATGEGTKAAENPRRREAEGMVTDAVSSPPPSRSETPVIVWI